MTRVRAVDDPSVWTYVLLALAGLFAGFVDAVVGGGGLVQLPALVVAFPGAAPVQILATNKLAGTCGTSVSSLTYYRRVRPDPRTFVPLMVVAFVGSALGAVVASHIPKAAFNPIILVALVVVGAYVLLKPDIGDVTELRFSGHRHTLAAVRGRVHDRLLRRCARPGHRFVLRVHAGRPARLQLPRGLREGADRQLGDEHRRTAGVRRAGRGDVAGRAGRRGSATWSAATSAPAPRCRRAAGSSGCSSWSWSARSS